MDRTFWLEKWAHKQIGFHRDGVHPDLVDHAPSFLGDGPHRVLVPLCGKTVDLHWLAESGHQVTGVELSDIAAREFHQEQGRSPTRSVAGPFTVLQSPNLRYLVGDVFGLDGTFDRVWDRAALVALAPEQRRPYVNLVRRVASGGELLLVTFDYDPTVMSGPPFALPHDEVRDYYPEAEILFHADILEHVPAFRERGHGHWHKTVWRARLP